MIAYLVTSEKTPTIMDWQNTTWLFSMLQEALDARETYKKDMDFDGYVLRVEMNDRDVVQAVANCMHGGSCKVKIEVLETY